MLGELPNDFVTFARSAGFVAADQWPEASIKSLKNSWRGIINQKKAGWSVMLPIFSLLYRMNEEDDAFLSRSGFEGESRLRSVHEQSIRILDLYPKISEGVTKAQKKPKSRFVQIGFGLTSTYKHRSLDRLSVKIDEHTKPISKPSRNILHVPGWSINGAFYDDQV
ncbi:hypothetical protein [Pseudomonas kribbensis]|uniref:Uncharacterized protein n=1 Tax=Pseudomonas kribbensis TaxID=1628086 RepID=A0A4Y8VFL2_9PSED|nr:hypothetical protein [Pseudomonas kribbensis]TFH79818.1 hypothetical protein E4J90_14150 [Pseudomonas kribbensis]